jgi:hypothetical protein
MSWDGSEKGFSFKCAYTLVEDSERLFHSGEKGKACIAREYCLMDKGCSFAPGLPGWSFLRLICEGNLPPPLFFPLSEVFD